MLKHIRDFEACVSQHDEVERFLVDYVVQPKIASVQWVDAQDPCSYLVSLHPNLFKFDKTDCYCSKSANIIPWRNAHKLRTIDEQPIALPMQCVQAWWGHHPSPDIPCLLSPKRTRAAGCRVGLRHIFAWKVILKCVTKSWEVSDSEDALWRGVSKLELGQTLCQVPPRDLRCDRWDVVCIAMHMYKKNQISYQIKTISHGLEEQHALIACKNCQLRWNARTSSLQL